MDELKSLQSDLMKYRQLVLQVKEKLLAIADDMDDFEKKLQISKTTGQGVAVAGGIISAVGIGLSFFTFGSSLALTVAGGLIGGAGGITTGASCIVDYFESNKILEEINKRLEKLNDSKEKLIYKCHSISKGLDDIEEIPAWTGFWCNMVGGSAKVGWGLAWNVIGKTVTSGVRLADLSVDVARGTVTVVRTLGRTGMVLHVAGGVLGSLLLPLDIGFLAYHANEVANPKEHDVSKTIRDIVSKLNCPSEHDINNAIREVRVSVSKKR